MTDDIDRAIRLRISAFEDAWNRGDIAAVIAQNHSSVAVISKSEFWDYAKEISTLESMMSKNGRQRLRFEVNAVRPLGRDYALTNGRFNLISPDGSEESGLFTTIYMRSDGQWKIIYAHS